MTTPSSAAVPVPAVTSAALKPPSSDHLRAYAKGVIAHIAIQTMYRIQHPGNLVITERSVWVGDTRASSISRFLDNVDTVVNLAKSVARASGATKKLLKNLGTDNLSVVLIYLIDLSTTELSEDKVIRKRFDIVDFGPTVIGPVSRGRFGEAYEIKSFRQADEGKDYITKQTNNYNATLQKLRQTFEEAFDISGLGGYQLRPGRTWPPEDYSPQLLPVGPNILLFWLEQPGVICYEWLSFKELSMKELWEYVKKVEEDIRKVFEGESALRPEVVLVLIFAGVMATFALGAVVLAASELIAAVGAAEAGLSIATALARLVQSGALPIAGSLTGASAAAAPQKPPLAPSKMVSATSTKEMNKLEALLDALDRMEPIDIAPFDRSYRPTAPSQDGLPGGTPPTQSEQAVTSMVEAIVSETVFLHSVNVGQGDERLNEDNLSILKDNLRIWLQAFIAVYGLDNLLAIAGRSGSAEFNETTAFEIGQLIIAAANGNLDSTRYGVFVKDFFSLSTDDVEESLPQDYNDDGEE